MTVLLIGTRRCSLPRARGEGLYKNKRKFTGLQSLSKTVAYPLIDQLNIKNHGNSSEEPKIYSLIKFFIINCLYIFSSFLFSLCHMAW